MAKRVLRSQHHQQNTEIAESSSQTPERSEKPEKSDRAADKTERYEKNENVVPVKKEEIQNRFVFTPLMIFIHQVWKIFKFVFCPAVWQAVVVHRMVLYLPIIYDLMDRLFITDISKN